MKGFKIFSITFCLFAGAGCICTAAWIYGTITGLIATGAALLLGAMLLSEVLRDDGNG